MCRAGRASRRRRFSTAVWRGGGWRRGKGRTGCWGPLESHGRDPGLQPGAGGWWSQIWRGGGGGGGGAQTSAQRPSLGDSEPKAFFLWQSSGQPLRRAKRPSRLGKSRISLTPLHSPSSEGPPGSHFQPLRKDPHFHSWEAGSTCPPPAGLVRLALVLFRGRPTGPHAIPAFSFRMLVSCLSTCALGNASSALSLTLAHIHTRSHTHKHTHT